MSLGGDDKAGITKFGRAKNIQNSVRFRTTFKFDCEYLWNGERYRQDVKMLMALSSRVSELNKKLMNFGPLTKKL